MILLSYILNPDGYIENFCIGGRLDESEIIEVSDIPTDFMMHYHAYKVEDGQLVFDASRLQDLDDERELEELRGRRTVECFEYVNRGELWYNMLTEEQLAELDEWYKAWLNVTETRVVPDRPEWLK